MKCSECGSEKPGLKLLYGPEDFARLASAVQELWLVGVITKDEVRDLLFR